uniref:Placenta associated 8 n=1 Tax=Sander lucioperca TaxID=283035 RepID=A0A8C9XG84_SANLU
MQLTVLPKRQERGENTKAASQTTGTIGQTTDELVATSSIDLIMAVTNQPGSYAPSDFQTGLFDVCKDCGTCSYGVLCYWCIGRSIASDMNEFFLCGRSTAIRSIYRTKYNIRGSVCNDLMLHVCCPCCAIYQLKTDINRRKEQGIF